MGRTLLLPLLLVLAVSLPRTARAQPQPQGVAPQPPSTPAPAAAAADPAAGNADPKKRPVRGSAATAPAAQPSGPSSQDEAEPAATTAPETPSPAQAAPISAEPAVAASPARSASAPAEVEDEDEEPKVPWIASLSWGQALNVAALSRSAYPSYNPQYAWSFTLDLGYRFDKLTSITLSQGAALELTDSDVTNTRQELWLLDTAIDLRRKLLKLEVASDQSFSVNGRAGVLLPTSKASQAATMVVAGRARLTAGYEFERVLQGLSASAGFGYAHRFLRSNTVEAESAFACDTTANDPFENCAHLGSSTNTRELFLLLFTGSLGLTEQFTLGADLSFGWNLGSSFPTERSMIATGVVTVEDTSVTHWRNSRVLGLSLEYAITDWFSATAQFTNSFAERGPRGQYRAPLDPLDTVLGLELSISFDQLYATAHGLDQDD